LHKIYIVFAKCTIIWIVKLYARISPFSFYCYLSRLSFFAFIWFSYLELTICNSNGRSVNWLSIYIELETIYIFSFLGIFVQKCQSISSHVAVNWWLLAHEVLINFILILEAGKKVDNWVFPFWLRLLAWIQNLEQKQLELKVFESNRCNTPWTMRRALSIISTNKLVLPLHIVKYKS